MTVLIIGGAYQGKRQFAKDRFGLQDMDFISGETCTPAAFAHAKAVDGLHSYIRRFMEQDNSEILQKLNGKIVICNEIGCGVVPVEQEQELWREKTGRICCDFAKQAEIVVRVHAGLGHILKGQIGGGVP
jgi:adenosyl cobinamide kinase/adenosyl cobinamide phosphate guanylyltransferase